MSTSHQGVWAAPQSCKAAGGGRAWAVSGHGHRPRRDYLAFEWQTGSVRERTDSVRLQLRTFAKHWVSCAVGGTGRRRSGQRGKPHLEFAWASVRPTWRNHFMWTEDSGEIWGRAGRGSTISTGPFLHLLISTLEGVSVAYAKHKGLWWHLWFKTRVIEDQEVTENTFICTGDKLGQRQRTLHGMLSNSATVLVPCMWTDE